jgi:hypothetical protein
MNKKSQLSVIELPILLILFSTFVIYFGTVEQSQGISYDNEYGSLLDLVIENQTYRDIIYDENLSQSSITATWTPIGNLLNNKTYSYELIVGNATSNKNIYSCNATYEKFYLERVLLYKNSTTQEFRFIRLGVCH